MGERYIGHDGCSASKCIAATKRRRLMSGLEVPDGTRAGFCKARGARSKTFRTWPRRLGLVTRSESGTPGGFVEFAVSSGLVRDAELSLGDGVALRMWRFLLPPARVRQPVAPA